MRGATKKDEHYRVGKDLKEGKRAYCCTPRLREREVFLDRAQDTNDQPAATNSLTLTCAARGPKQSKMVNLGARTSHFKRQLYFRLNGDTIVMSVPKHTERLEHGRDEDFKRGEVNVKSLVHSTTI